MNIGAANASLSLLIPPLFPVPQVLQQFAADDIYSFDEIESVETLMGVDGFLSAGWTYKPQPQTITLQADSISNNVFDIWNNNQVAGRTTYVASGVLILPQIGLKFIQTQGFLTAYKLPDGKKLVQPRRFRITWKSVVAVPA